MRDQQHELEELKVREKEYREIFAKTKGRLNASVGHFMGQDLIRTQARIKTLEKRLENNQKEPDARIPR
jgi:gluconate kinase